MTNDGKYKYELHCHTKEVSACGQVPAAELVRLYKAKGYDGVVITDHYSALTYPGLRMFQMHDRVDSYLCGYRAALEAAPADFTVLLGMEKRAYLSPIDFLVYGVTEELLRENGNLLFVYARRFCEIAHRYGALVVAAHPFRMAPFKANPKVVDGAELFNGKQSPDGNRKAVQWAQKHQLPIRTYGSDFHRKTHRNFSGILTTEPIRSNEDLLRILRTGRFEPVFPD